MTKVRVELPPKLIPVFTGPARYRGSYGGRGSGKTRSFAKMAAVRAYMFAAEGREGIILCGREFMNSLDESSMSEVKAAIASEPWLADGFDIGEKYIRTTDRRVEFKFAGLSRNIDSIKSKSQILLCWVDEAEPVSETAWQKIIPTVREHGSEIWVTWNPERKNSATHLRFRANPPEGAKIVEMNYRDNPWFPEVLERERLEDQSKRPENYAHIWEGDFVTALAGAYFAKHLHRAKSQGRIGFFPEDVLMPKKAFFDIGGTGRKADATAIWVAQFIGTEIRVIDHYEARHQPLETHVRWLRRQEHTSDSTSLYLPHDGANGEKVYDVSYQSALSDAGYEVEVIENQGRGAAMDRVDAVRRIFNRIRFNADTTEAGRDALGWYHEKIDEERSVGLGPDHDWSSHSADAFGLMAIVYEEAPPLDGNDMPQISDEYQAQI